MSLEKLLGSEELFEGRYKILDVIGRGGMSTVYLAKNSRLGTLWAIKEKSRLPEATGAIYNEIDVLKRLEHPALPRIYDVIENEAYIYVIEDYITGTTLEQELDAVGRFDETRVLEWTLQLCDVLDYLHSIKPNPVIYRDIKPSNIMLTYENRLKLVDFGSAREYKSMSDCDTVCLGTVGYAAPEQYGQGQTGVTSDIYSLGITVHNLVTGIRPGPAQFEQNSSSVIKGAISPGLEAVISKCIRFQPSERYQNISEVREEIKRLIEPSSEKRPPPSAGIGSQKLVSFKRLVLGVWDSPEFACELACMTAGLTGLRVLMIIPDESKDAYFARLGLRNTVFSTGRPASPVNSERPGMEAVKSFSHAGGGTFSDSCIHVKGTLYAIPIPFYQREEAGDAVNLEQAIACSYQDFDITFTAFRRCLCTEEQKLALLQSDYILIALSVDMNMLLEWLGEINHAKATYGLQQSKFKFIAYEYKQGINLPLSFLKNNCSPGCLIGCVSYSREREICRNTGKLYSGILKAKNPYEYVQILSFFNIYPKPCFKARLVHWLARHKLFMQTDR